MTNREILIRRKKVEAELKRANNNLRVHRREQAVAESKSRAAQEALTAGRLEVGRGIMGVDIPGLSEQVQVTQEAVREAKLQADATDQAQRTLTYQLKNTLATHFDVYKHVAEQSTKEAHEALKVAHEAIAVAERKWADARAAWTPLVLAVNADDLKRHPKLKEPFPLFPISTVPNAIARPGMR